MGLSLLDAIMKEVCFSRFMLLRLRLAIVIQSEIKFFSGLQLVYQNQLNHLLCCYAADMYNFMKIQIYL